MYDPTKPYKDQILNTIKQTWKTPYISVSLGVYPMIKRRGEYANYREMDHTDGLGTKGDYHWKKRTLENATLDSLAMGLNDLAMARAIPYKLQDHLTLPEDNRGAIFKVIETLTRECLKRDIAITGGETSIHNNSSGIEISLTMSGFIKKYKPNKAKIGDVLIGLRSAGLHSNGFTDIREVFGDEFCTEFVKPTRIYLEEVFHLNETFDINGMMHITGGAYTKLKGILDQNSDIIIKTDHVLSPQAIFFDLYNRGISDEKMYKTFNCGIGFILSASEKEAVKIENAQLGHIIGEVTNGRGKIKIKSMFSDREVKF